MAKQKADERRAKQSEAERNYKKLSRFQKLRRAAGGSKKSPPSATASRYAATGSTSASGEALALAWSGGVRSRVSLDLDDGPLARLKSGWLVNWATYFVCCAFTIITCQVKGRVWTQGWMLSVLSANGMTWGLVEPLECLIVVSLPFLFDNKAVAWFRTKMKDLGFY